MSAFKRVALFLGEQALEKLKNSSVAVFGVGGVGGFVCEALCRSGVGSITVFDSDKIDQSNLNRQIIATMDTVGKDKVDVICERLKSINPDIVVNVNKVFYLSENAEQFDLSNFDYIVDAVDTVSAKIEIISRAKSLSIPVISCMGTGGKIDVTRLRVSDIEKTHACPLARVMRRELRARRIKNVKVVWSDEEGIKPISSDDKKADGKSAPPSMIFVPATAGLLIAEQVIQSLIKG